MVSLCLHLKCKDPQMSEGPADGRIDGQHPYQRKDSDVSLEMYYKHFKKASNVEDNMSTLDWVASSESGK